MRLPSTTGSPLARPGVHRHHTCIPVVVQLLIMYNVVLLNVTDNKNGGRHHCILE